MRQLRRADERGGADHGWLDTRHTFSFADYHDPRHMGFRSLRVINEDFVAPGNGFGTHPHRDMEIITHVLSGRLQHRDSMGNGAEITPGELQRITAGTGILHSEANPDDHEATHLYQIWLLPSKRGLTPSWEQKRFDFTPGAWTLVASPEGAAGSLTINQDARLLIGRFAAGGELHHDLGAGRHAWLQVTKGRAEADGVALSAGDGLAVSDEGSVHVRGVEDGEMLLFDLA